MLHILRAAVPVAVASVLWSGTAAAQSQNTTRVGSYLAYHFDVRDPGVGAQLDVPVTPRLTLYPSGGVFLVDQGSLWGVNADVKYWVTSPLYVGGGLNIMQRSLAGTGRTDTGVNLLTGLEGHMGWRLHPFAEGRVILNEGSAFLLGAGLRVAL
jgi:hypothetical protein